MKRKICIVTGTRAEYGLLKPVMTAVQNNSKLELLLIVTGMHLIPEFGNTIKEIKKDGFNIDAEIDMMIANDTLGSMAKSVGLGIIGIAQALERLKPDFLLVLGDRIEPLAAVVAASTMNIPIAHVGGGQKTGCVDNNMRNAMSKFANIHFARTPVHVKNLKEMGEEEWRIHLVGSLGVDIILNSDMIPADEIAKKFSLDLNDPILLAVFHSDTLDVKNSIRIAKRLCDALIKLDMQTIFIYPNADAGGRKILEIIKKCAEYPKIKLYRSLPQIEYHSLMKISSLMLGNSSSGIIEAPAFGLPMINMGTRQIGRDRFDNVVDVPGETDQIVKTAKKILSDTNYRNKLKKSWKIYGDGNAGEKIAKILCDIKISDRLLYKK